MAPIALPHPREQPTLDVDVAGRHLGLGRSAAYEAAREYERTGGASGLPVIRLGSRFRVPTAALWRLLQLDLPDMPTPPPDQEDTG